MRICKLVFVIIELIIIKKNNNLKAFSPLCRSGGRVKYNLTKSETLKVNDWPVSLIGSPICGNNTLSDHYFTRLARCKSNVERTSQSTAGVYFPQGGPHILHGYKSSASRLNFNRGQISVTVFIFHNKCHVERVCSGINMESYISPSI